MDTDTQYAGSPEQKAAAFMDLWTNPDIDTIMASCGGNFSSQFLHLLDYKLISKTPKTLIGFSDTTALLSALYARTGIGGVFGPTVQSLGQNDNLDVVFNILTGKSRLIDFSDCTPLSSIEKTNQSPLYAATLSVLLSLAGTAYFPNLSGHILILEDIGEELSHLDRMLWQLNQICPFDHLTGLVFGDFTDLKDSGRPLGLDYQGVIRKHTQNLKIPVFINAPVGHGSRFTPIPLGVSAQLENASTGLRLIF
jgi:muramoyltetrapeptide carboxypeptidase